MDDFVILDTDKPRLAEIKELIKKFLEYNLKLKLHPKKSEYFPIDRGIDFLGYIVFANKIDLRKSTVKRYWKRLRRRLGRLEKSLKLKELNRSLLS